MKKKIYQEIKIPEGVEATLERNLLKIKGPQGENFREFRVGKINFEKKENKIILGYEKATKKEKKIINTFAAHIRNMINGVQNKFEYKLKICFNHFPFTAEKKDDKVIIKNFLGEKIPREMNIPKGVDIEINQQDIIVTSLDKELAGQAASNFEMATKVRNRDRRVFQDGIFITSKAGREI
jgi:large subunit ribosomal protein L6